jgi:hypothetical protein
MYLLPSAFANGDIVGFTKKGDEYNIYYRIGYQWYHVEKIIDPFYTMPIWYSLGIGGISLADDVGVGPFV